jgi:hypothetical protein
MKSDLIDIDVEIVSETNLAFGVRDSEDSATVWLPKSIVEMERNANNRKMAVVTLPEWLAIEKGLV